MTPTPKDPVDALMELVLEYRQAPTVHAGEIRRSIEASARALAAVPAPDVEAAAWMHVDDPRRVISAMQKADAVKDGGASASSVASYTMPLIHRHEGAQQAGGVPAGFVLVPLSFLQGFHTLAHNYSLRAAPPDYYRGVEGDAFSSAYRRCGEDLAKLRAMLAAAPSPSAVQPLTAEQALRDALEAMGSTRAQALSAGDLMQLVVDVDTPQAKQAAPAVTVCYAAPEDLVRDGYSHSFYVHQTPPANRFDWVALCINKQEATDADGAADKPHTA